jgi:hypothetical protein
MGKKALTTVAEEMTKDKGKKRKTLDQVGGPETQFLDYDLSQPDTVVPIEIKSEETEGVVATSKPGSSPLDNTGPIPAELLNDPYAVEIVPLTTPTTVIPIEQAILTQERLIWISAIVVSWVVTAVAVLRAMKVI